MIMIESNTAAQIVRVHTQSGVRRALPVILWGSFLLLVGLLGFGIIHEKLFSQPIWTVVGLRRLLGLAAVYGLGILAAWRWRLKWLLPAGIGLAAIYAIASLGFGPVTSAVFLSLSLLALGDLSLSSFGWKRTTTPFREAAILSFLSGTALLCFAIGILAHFPVNYAGFYVTALALPLAINRRGLAFYLSAMFERPHRQHSGSEFASAGLLGFVLLAHFLVVLKPEVGFDALAMHLMAPAWVASHHAWSFDFRNFVWAVMPLAGDWIYLPAYLMGGEFASRLMNYSYLLATVWALYALARRHLPRSTSLLVAALLASIPLDQLVTGSLFIENILTAMLTAAALSLDRLKRTPQRTYWIAEALFLGTVVSIKFGGIAYAIPIAAIACWQLRQKAMRQSLTAGAALACLLTFAIVASFQYGYAWWVTGNPFYPFMNNVFRSPYYPPTAFDPFFRSWLSWDSLYKIVFRSHLYLESQNGAAGFQLLWVVPACVWALFLGGKRRIGAAASVTALAGSLIVLRTQPYLRYLYPGLPLLHIGFCSALAATRRIQFGLYRLLLGALVAVFLLNIFFLPASGWYQKDFALWTFLDGTESQAYEEQKAPARRIVEYLNLAHPGEPVWFVGNEQLAGLIGEPLLAGWHEPEFNAEVQQVRSVDDALRVAKRRGVRRFITPVDLREISGTPPAVISFLQQDAVPEFEHGSLVLLRLRDDLPKTEVLDAGNGSNSWLDWQRNGVVTVSPGGEARVTLADTLVRAYPFDPAITYTYSLEASCPEPNTVLRLQINWHDKAGRFIGTSLEPRACYATWDRYVKTIKPPSGTVSGVVIVAGHSKSPVFVRRVILAY
jgi:Dolichyl-phosphate-mannose-protein mannosyltransferase